MTAKEHLDRGDLRAAIEAATAEVKAKPSEEKARTLLFELLCFAGDLDRAEKHLEVLGSGETQLALAVLGYKSILSAERERRRVFAGKAKPEFLDGEPPYAARHLEALASAASGDGAAARRALGDAEAGRARLQGRANGRPFEDFRDADDLVAPFLEAFVGARYAWIPFDGVARIALEAPKRLRDLLWAHAKVELKSGEVGDVTVPVLYEGTHAAGDDAIRLGRKSDWLSTGGGPVRGVGQRVFIAAEEEGTPLLEIREIAFGETGGPR